MLDPILCADSLILFWHKLAWPLLRLLLFMSAGLLVAGFIEALDWTSKLACVAAPLVRFGHLSDVAAAAFSVSFVSGMTANAMLSEAYEKKTISRLELVLANLFNSLPTYFLHLPTTFLLAASLIKEAAVVYMALTLGAAALRSAAIVAVSRVLLPSRELAAAGKEMRPKNTQTDWKTAWQRTVKRFRGRILKIARFTVPIYILFFLLAKTGVFRMLENVLAARLSFLAWLSPKAISIIGLQMASEFTGGMAVAGALLQDGSMDGRQVVLALLTGNVLSSPVRAIRHQFPYYAGIFRPRLALLLIASNQGFRASSIALAALLYFFVAL